MKNHPLPVLAFFLGLLFFLAGEGDLTAAKPTLSEVYETVKQASVEVIVDDHISGSGAFVDAKGIVLTAAHVVDRPDRRLEIVSPVAGRLSAELLAYDLGHDLALLSVAPREGDYPALTLAPRTPSMGTDIYLFGMPIYRHYVMQRGMVARNGLTFECIGSRQLYIETYHVSGMVQIGTSGGPWVDDRGRLVGLQSGMMVAQGAAVGLAFPIPVEAIRKLLKERKNAVTPSLGIAVEEVWQQQPDTLRRYPPGTEGLVVRFVYDRNSVTEAGVKQWDVIQEADGEPMRMPDQLLRYVRSMPLEEPIRLKVLSPDNGEIRLLEVPRITLESAWESGLPPEASEVPEAPAGPPEVELPAEASE